MPPPLPEPEPETDADLLEDAEAHAVELHACTAHAAAEFGQPDDRTAHAGAEHD
jgi:hypothetical protein